ncbi:MAG: DUF1801 domain-containing protein [Terricaulis sp.]
MPTTVAAVFRAAPVGARARMSALRDLILDTAAALELGAVEETLKWGEPAYLVDGGSPVRLGWKARAPDEVAMYFICTTNLVDYFRELYPVQFRFAGNRALVFDLRSRLPTRALMHCIELAFTYHRKRTRLL